VNGINDRLYALLPTAIRVSDAGMQGEPLRSVLSVISEQVDLLENDVAQLYDNWFIETCAEWAIPYIGDLIGYEVLHESGEPTVSATRETLALDRILIPRQDVSNTVHARRRKGTLGVLPELARDVAGWPAIAVEFGRLASSWQALNDARLNRGRTVDVRRPSAIESIGQPSDASSRTMEVRESAMASSSGSLPTSGVGLFVPRYRSYSVSNSTAAWIRDVGDHCFTFSPLAEDQALYARPQLGNVDADRGVVLPVALLRDDVANPRFYGEGKSFAIWTLQEGEKGEPTLVPIEAIVPANLRHWRHEPPHGKVAVDAALGRLSFRRGEVPRRVLVSYHYGFSFEIGAGEYQRLFAALPSVPLIAAVVDTAVTLEGTSIGGIDVVVTIDGAANATYTTSGTDTLATVATALAKAIDGLAIPTISAVASGNVLNVNNAQSVQISFPSRVYSVASKRRESHGRLSEALKHWKADAPARAVIEIEDSEVYNEEDLDIALTGDQYLQIRAANGARPVVRMVDSDVGGPDLVDVTGDGSSVLAIDGLLLEGGMRIGGHLGELVVRRSTLVPGWRARRKEERRGHIEPSLKFSDSPKSVRIEQTILGPISVERAEAAPRPLRMTIADCIVDSDHRGEALSSPDADAANAELRLARVTTIGRVRAHSILLAENTIFANAVIVTDRQHGCFRFCYVAPRSKTPSRYECQPTPSDDVSPAFVSERYGDTGYARLQGSVPKQIAEGADDRSEMGVFHDLFLPQRKANLTTRLAEYTPAGVVTSIIEVN
jgi:hypothetical protein